jgi:hypothetical protein
VELFWTNRREKRTANSHISAMGSVSAKQDPFVAEAPDQSLPDFAAATDVAPEVPVGQPFAVRETHRLYRLKTARFLAVVAADTEDEARVIAAREDALGGDWRDPEFASAEFEDTGDVHVFGDVVISAYAAPPADRSKKS